MAQHSNDCPCACHTTERFKFLESLCKCDPVLREPEEAARRGLIHDLRMGRDPAMDFRTDRDALMAIRDYPANGNSEPGVMSRAIETMQAIAAAQLEGDDWSHLVEEGEGDHEL
jgi:hypothetical protein